MGPQRVWSGVSSPSQQIGICDRDLGFVIIEKRNKRFPSIYDVGLRESVDDRNTPPEEFLNWRVLEKTGTALAGN